MRSIIFCKLLPAREPVQLIVFFAAIREILKKKIYEVDKRRFFLIENKGHAEEWQTEDCTDGE
jgi:hypothetical protein